MTVSNWVAVLLFAVLFICFLCLEREHQKRITSEFTAELRQSNIDELHRAIEKCEERERASAELMRAKDAEIYVLREAQKSDWNERKRVIAEYVRVKSELIDIDKAIDEAVEELEIEDLDLENFDFIKEP